MRLQLAAQFIVETFFSLSPWSIVNKASWVDNSESALSLIGLVAVISKPLNQNLKNDHELFTRLCLPDKLVGQI